MLTAPINKNSNLLFNKEGLGEISKALLCLSLLKGEFINPFLAPFSKEKIRGGTFQKLEL